MELGAGAKVVDGRGKKGLGSGSGGRRHGKCGSALAEGADVDARDDGGSTFLILGDAKVAKSKQRRVDSKSMKRSGCLFVLIGSVFAREG